MRGTVTLTVALGLVAASGMAASGCGDDEREVHRSRFSGATIDGEHISQETLRRGEFAYMRWCARCHGPDGKGHGPRGRMADPKPLDLTKGIYPRADVKDGELPPDAHFEKVIREGVPNTIMEPMDIPDKNMGPLVAYVKWLAPRFRE